MIPRKSTGPLIGRPGGQTSVSPHLQYMLDVLDHGLMNVPELVMLLPKRLDRLREVVSPELGHDRAGVHSPLCVRGK